MTVGTYTFVGLRMAFGVLREEKEVGPQAAETLLKQGKALAVDVREPSEWEAGHIKGALHIPLADLPRRVDELPTDRELIAVCRSGVRSAQATHALSRAGYEVTNLGGGMKAWYKAGLAIEPRDGRIA